MTNSILWKPEVLTLDKDKSSKRASESFLTKRQTLLVGLGYGAGFQDTCLKLWLMRVGAPLLFFLFSLPTCIVTDLVYVVCEFDILVTGTTDFAGCFQFFSSDDVPISWANDHLEG